MFTGRAALLRHLVEHLHGDEVRSLVVTGAAGSGKSAILGYLVALSDPAFRRKHADDLEHVSAELLPPLGSIDLALVATARSPYEVRAGLVQAVSPDLETSPSLKFDEEFLEHYHTWQSWIRDQDRTVTIVIDSVDEAVDPHILIEQVLTKLNQPRAHPPKVRLIIGIRSSQKSDAFSEANPTALPLADLAEKVLHATRIRVDAPPWFTAEDLTAYAFELLTGDPGSSYRAHRAAAAVTARTIAERSGSSYAFARLAATALALRDVPVQPDDRLWRHILERSTIGLFTADLHDFLPDPERRARSLHLLRAIAFARGRGLPCEHVWPRVAEALADRSHTFDEQDVDELLATPLSRYITFDREDGIAVHRIADDAVRSALRGSRRDLSRDIR